MKDIRQWEELLDYPSVGRTTERPSNSVRRIQYSDQKRWFIGL